MGRTVRVTVRGSFDNLSAEQLAALVADGAGHDFLNTQYTPEGYLAYDLPGRPFFTFRFVEEVADADEVPQAGVRAQAKAEAWMAARGYPVKNLTTQTVDMAEVPLGKRGRREAERKS
ncbi:DUF6204 family protein [Actinoplanes sp. URMC 104]|uniref:DUF6204 family protein n=1 Tax=Actinoplanes sp. URMC 104 TaxID=3423409 RepID=UPI003F1AD99A